MYYVKSYEGLFSLHSLGVFLELNSNPIIARPTKRIFRNKCCVQVKLEIIPPQEQGSFTTNAFMNIM